MVNLLAYDLLHRFCKYCSERLCQKMSPRVNLNHDFQRHALLAYFFECKIHIVMTMFRTALRLDRHHFVYIIIRRLVCIDCSCIFTVRFPFRVRDLMHLRTRLYIKFCRLMERCPCHVYRKRKLFCTVQFHLCSPPSVKSAICLKSYTPPCEVLSISITVFRIFLQFCQKLYFRSIRRLLLSSRYAVISG